MRATIFMLLALALSTAAAPAGAAGSSSSSSRGTAPSEFQQAEMAVKAGDYRNALSLLTPLVKREPDNADAWNYIGFSHRKLGEYKSSLAAYSKALAVDPRHRGALEYLGELYLKMGDVEQAKVQLKKLDKACFFGCEEYDDLKAAIAKHTG